MSGGQIAALVFAILLLFPGGCFLVVGIGLSTEPSIGDFTLVALLVIIGAIILSGAGALFWVAFRRRTAPPRSAGPGIER